MQPVFAFGLRAALILPLLAFALITSGCSGGGGGGGTVGGSTSTGASGSTAAVKMTGQAVDGPVAGATVSFFADANLTIPVTTLTAVTDATGNFSVAIPAANLSGLSQVFLKITGGTDIDTGQAPAVLTATVSTVAVSGGTTLQVSITPLSSVLVRAVEAHPDLDEDDLREELEEMFGSDTDTLDLDTPPSANANLEEASEIVGELAEEKHGGLGSHRERVEALLSELAEELATGSVDIDEISHSQANVHAHGHGHGHVVPKPPPAFELTDVLVNSATFNLTTATVTRGDDGARVVSIASTAALTGATLSNVSFDLVGNSHFATGSRFRGTIELVLKPQGATDHRSLTISVGPLQITALRGQSAGDIRFLGGTKLRVSGTDAAGNVVPEFELVNAGASAPGVLTAVNLGTSTRVTFSLPAVQALLRANLSAQAFADSPISLINSTDLPLRLLLEFRGFPVLVNGRRVSRIELGLELTNSLLLRLTRLPTLTASTIPPNGDLNPYGVAFVPAAFAAGPNIHPGDILVSNFNDSANIQGTGSTIVGVPASGRTTTYFRGTPGLGLDTALGVLTRGFVLVGALPTPTGQCATIGQTSLSILDRNGALVQRLTDNTLLHGPWDLTLADEGDSAIVFVANVQSGTVTRLDLATPQGLTPTVSSKVQIASGYASACNTGAVIIGPTGLAYDGSRDILYVASTADNEIFAVPNAAAASGDHGTGSLVYRDNGHLRGPLGLVLAPNGHLITANGDAVNADASHPSELVEFTTAGSFVAQFQLDPNPDGAFGIAVDTEGGTLRFAAVNDNTNMLEVWTLR